MSLTPSQQAVVDSEAPRIYVSASPGSGKTHTLITRIARRVASGADPSKIALITFTNAAASEMADRLAKVGIKAGFVGTLHAFLIILLQTYGHRIGYRRSGVAVVTEEEVDALFTELFVRFGYGKSIATLRKKRTEPAEALIWGEYQHFLKRNNLVDFDTILTDGLKLVRLLSRKEVGFDEVYADEVQDSGETDWDIYISLPIDRKFYVGDSDQSIYAFRGAKAHLFTDHIRDVQADMRDGSEAFCLEESFRCAPLIARAANELIGHNLNRIPKNIIADATRPEGKVEHQFSGSQREEFANLCKRIHTTDAPNSWAVLAPTNALAQAAAEHFRAAGWPVAKTRQKPLDFLSEKAMQLLRFAADPESEFRARNIPDAIRGTVPSGTDSLFLSWLGLSLSNFEVDYIRGQLRNIPFENPSPADLLQQIREQDVEELTEEEGITACTIHSAKGREWNNVAIIGLEMNVLPRKGHCLEESRRLLFVGMTRARHSLTLCHASERRTPWGVTTNPPSPFLKEIFP